MALASRDSDIAKRHLMSEAPASPSQLQGLDAGRSAHRLAVLLTAIFVMCESDVRAQSARTGQQVFEAACAACHGVDGTGSAAAAADYPVIPPDFTACTFSTREPMADWIGVTHDGGPVRAFSRLMPAFGEALSRQEIELAVSHAKRFCTDDRWPPGDLNFPRALVTSKAFPEDEAVLTVSADGGAVTNQFLWERRIGSRGQVEIIVPLSFTERAPGDWTGGFGDLTFAFKQVMAHSSRRGSILSVAGELSVPTGSTERSIGSGTAVAEPFVAFGQRLPGRGFLQLQAGAGIPFDRDRADEVFWRAAVGHPFRDGEFGRLFAPMVEVLGARDLVSGERALWDLAPQLHVTLSTRQHIRVNAGVRIPVNERAGRSTQFLSYFLWEWFGGGLSSGW
jgi:hypothetical protein